MEEFMLPCLNKQLFGIDCLGCGAQRSLLLFFQGEFSAAFKMYPAIYPLLFLLLFLIINFFVNFKNSFYIKAALIVLNAVVIVMSYFFKMQAFF